MDFLIKLDWSDLFVPKLSLAEAAIRGTLIYFGLCIMLRIITKRQVGKSSLTDLLFVILIGSFAADGISKNASSLTDYFVVQLTIVLLAYLFDWLTFRYRWFRHLIMEPPTCLIKDGKILTLNLRRELISEDDLRRELRRHDVDDPAKVKEAQLEGDGEISIVKKENRASAALTLPAEPRSEGEPQEAVDDQDLRDFLAAAEKVQARLLWHQEQIAKLKDALTRNGVRPKPLTMSEAKVEPNDT